MMRRKIIFVTLFLFLGLFLFADDASDIRQDFIDSAKKYLGVPYVWGGSTSNGMDCSGLVMTAAKEGTGISLPRTTTSIFDYVDIIPFGKAEPGDLLFFKDGSSISHVAIYLGGIEFIHCASDGPRTGVIISDLEERYWKKYFYATGRFLDSNGNGNGNENENEYRVSEKSHYAPPDTRPSSAGDISFSHDNSSGFFASEIDFSLPYQLFDSTGFHATMREGANVFVRLNILFNQFKVGIGGGTLFSKDSVYYNFPVFVTIGFPHGFKFDIGTYFLYDVETLAEALAGVGESGFIHSENYPLFVNFSWQTPNLQIGDTGLSLVQNVIWEGELKQENVPLKDTFLLGLDFSIGLRMTMGI